MGFFIFCVIVVGMGLSFVAALEFSSIAVEKGHDGTKYFWYTFLLGIMGALMVVALPDRNLNVNGERNNSNIYRKNNKNDLDLDASVLHSRNFNVNNTNNDSDASNKNKKEYFSGESVSVIITDQNTVICPLCEFEQQAERTICWKCGCKFITEKEK